MDRSDHGHKHVQPPWKGAYLHLWTSARHLAQREPATTASLTLACSAARRLSFQEHDIMHARSHKQAQAGRTAKPFMPYSSIPHAAHVAKEDLPVAPRATGRVLLWRFSQLAGRLWWFRLALQAANCMEGLSMLCGCFEGQCTPASRQLEDRLESWAGPACMMYTSSAWIPGVCANSDIAACCSFKPGQAGWSAQHASEGCMGAARMQCSSFCRQHIARHTPSKACCARASWPGELQSMQIVA